VIQIDVHTAGENLTNMRRTLPTQSYVWERGRWDGTAAGSQSAGSHRVRFESQAFEVAADMQPVFENSCGAKNSEVADPIDFWKIWKKIGEIR
jgi:hypothetical protein